LGLGNPGRDDGRVGRHISDVEILSRSLPEILLVSLGELLVLAIPEFQMSVTRTTRK
jgi:hypothetical protein